ncbi:hypothetical protein Z946_3223 [Sulfitobacter noctilucicola]|nr:hypothetical protein Z946_3223 [Sulfitobacter noctilucicola]
MIGGAGQEALCRITPTDPLRASQVVEWRTLLITTADVSLANRSGAAL